MAKLKPQDKGRKPTDDDTDDDDLDDEEKPLTRGDALRLVNSAVSAQLARKLPKAIEDGVAPLTAQLTEIGERITAPQPGKGGKGKRRKQRDEDDDDEDDDSGGGHNPQVAELTKQVAALTGKLKEQTDAAASAARAQREGALNATLREALAKAKVDPLRIKGALAVVRENLVRDKDGNVAYDDEGKAKWRAKRDGYDDELDLEAGIGEWSGTDEGKSYQAASGSPGGAGARSPGSGGRPTGKPQNAGEAKGQRIREAKEGLLSAVQGMLAGGGSIAIDGVGGDPNAT